MPETISMDESQADAPELNADEQESLALGEQMQAAENQLLAGKYKSVEELEKGYLEAQKALSNQSEPEVQEEPEQEVSETQTFLNSASAEYAENGELSEDTMSKLTAMSSEELVNAYISSQVNNQQSVTGYSLDDSQVKSIKDSIGGESRYEELVNWAGNNLDAASVQAFDSLVETGNAKAIELAVAGLNARYEAENGSEGQMITGKAPTTNGERFRSQAEVVEAMSDPRYDRDPAYRQEIIEKLERSDNFF
jgi:hypothetical protein|tara:strand:+ start:270 stop:1025 length:756 start_codon:yes stop_codon:yes gene_type:complete